MKSTRINGGGGGTLQTKRTSLLATALAALIIFSFAACGSGGKTAYSSDGISWTAGINLSNTINSIAYGSNKFVAGGNKSFYSSNGETWTLVTNSIFGTSGIEALAFGGGTFVAGGGALMTKGGKIAYSTK